MWRTKRYLLACRRCLNIEDWRFPCQQVTHKERHEALRRMYQACVSFFCTCIASIHRYHLWKSVLSMISRQNADYEGGCFEKSLACVEPHSWGTSGLRASSPSVLKFKDSLDVLDSALWALCASWAVVLCCVCWDGIAEWCPFWLDGIASCMPYSLILVTCPATSCSTSPLYRNVHR